MKTSSWKYFVLTNSSCANMSCYKDSCIKVIHGEKSPWIGKHILVGAQWLCKNLKGEALASYVAERIQGTIKIEEEPNEAYKKS